MATLEEKLQQIRDGAAKRLPEETRAIMHRATDELRSSAILDSVIKVGATLPAFSLTNARGDTVQSADLLGSGAVVLTVFRGSW